MVRREIKCAKKRKKFGKITARLGFGFAHHPDRADETYSASFQISDIQALVLDIGTNDRIKVGFRLKTERKCS